jgi:hypothetical protein
MNTTQIPLDDLKKSFLLNEGVYCGNIFEYLDSNEIEYLKNLIEEIKEYSINERDTNLYCRYNYHLYDGKDGGINENDEFKHSIKLSEVADRDLFVEQNNREVLQKWFEFDGFNDDCKFFMKISERIIKYFYPNEEIEYYQIPHFTLYEDGHFIADHNDGENVGRVCGLIIYLSYEEDYNDGGGELVIKTNSNNQYAIRPIFGTFSLLDFTQNDIRHSVNIVKNGFKRYSFIYFFNRVKNEYTNKQKLI